MVAATACLGPATAAGSSTLINPAPGVPGYRYALSPADLCQG